MVVDDDDEVNPNINGTVFGANCHFFIILTQTLPRDEYHCWNASLFIFCCVSGSFSMVGLLMMWPT